MRIQPESGHQALLPGYTRLAARVTSDQRGVKPELLWFDVPATAAAAVGSGDPWLLALLPLAFHDREPLMIDAPVDPVLRFHALELMSLWSRWYRGRRPVAIEAPVADPPKDEADRTALFFSAGVDSFYSLLHFDAEAARGGERPLDELVYVWGYDLPLENRPAFGRKLAALGEIAARLDKTLIPVVSNLRQTRLGSLDWAKVMHGPALGAAALALASRHDRVLISGTLPRRIDEIYGSHPLADPLMSTSQSRFVHYQEAVPRHDKTAFIAGSTLALRHLHVCWEDASDRNCGRCEKCLRTRIALELLGVGERAGCFGGQPLALEELSAIRLPTPGITRMMAELGESAAAAGRNDLAQAIEQCLARNRVIDGLTASPWRRQGRRWARSVQKRWQEVRQLSRPRLASLALIVCLALGFGQCWLEALPDF